MDESMTAGEPTQAQIMERLTVALQESKGRTEMQLQTLERKIDQLARDLVSAEAEIRKELQTQFITRLEYEPRHLMLQQSMDTVNKTVGEVASVRDRVLILEQVSANNKKRLEELDKSLDDLDTRARGAIQRALPWVAIAITFLGLLTQLLQHVQIR